MEWMIKPLRLYATFSGRARPKEYWLFFLFFVLLIWAASFVDVALGWGTSERWATAQGMNASIGFNNSGGPLTAIVGLALLIPGLAVAVRRLHDTDRSGWWLLLVAVPLIGWIVLFVFLVTGGTRGTNRFGSDPVEAELA